MENKNLNVQSWMDVRDVAKLVRAFEERGIVVGNISQMLRECVSGLVRLLGAEEIGTEESIEYLRARNFSLQQLREGRSGLKIAKAIEQEAGWEGVFEKREEIFEDKDTPTPERFKELMENALKGL